MVWVKTQPICLSSILDCLPYSILHLALHSTLGLRLCVLTLNSQEEQVSILMNDFINLLLMRSLVTSALKRVLQAFLPTCYISATNGSNHSTDTVNVSKSSQHTSI